MKSALYKSLALHLAVLLLITVDVPWIWHRDMVLDQVPIIVDLEQVKISEMTNLPSKAKQGEEDKPAVRQKAPVVPPMPQPKPKPEIEDKTDSLVESETPQPENPKEEPLPPKQDFVVPPQPAKPKLPEKKEEPKKVTPPPAKKKPAPEAKKQTAPKAEKPKAQVIDNPLKNLLDSVNALEKNMGDKDNENIINKNANVKNLGIEGGVGGSYFSDLSISETDAIASRLRQCWNLDPGAMGIEDMVVEIRAYLAKDGSVQKVDILDSGRYSGDSHFRSVADSAKRAVYVCAPYTILSQKYGDKYDMWKTMLLRFNPINHTVN